MKTFHYGITLDSDTPTMGVIANNSCEYLYEDAFDNGIDLTYANHIKTCKEYQENDECNCFDCDCEPHTYLIGFVLNSKTGDEYIPDTKAEYSAIVGEIYTQVVASKYITRVRLCSPCYPGQGDLDSPDDLGQLAFCPPPECFGEFDEFPTNRIYNTITDEHYKMNPVG